MDNLLVAAAIFVFTYLLISVRRFPKINIGRATAAVIGAALMLIFGILSLTDAADYINFDVILLLLGMMMLVAGLEYSGFFRIISDWLVVRCGSKTKLLAYVMGITAMLSAVALNDAVVLLFTPIVINCCRRTGSNPLPYLIGVMVSANIGSLATSVGNPQNAIIASQAGISFIEFSAFTLPISLISLPVAFLIIYAAFRNNLTGDVSYCAETAEREIDPKRLKAAITVMIGTFLGFIVSGYIHVPIHLIALIAGILSLLIVATASVENVKWVAGKIDWSILIFFAGLFILMGGVVESGLLDHISSFFPGFGDGETPSVLGLTAFSAVLSNLVSNVPAVVLIGGMLPPDSTGLWMALAASSTLAGNATLIGSAANIIVAERSEDYGIKVDFWKFLMIGIPIAVITLLISAAMITVLV